MALAAKKRNKDTSRLLPPRWTRLARKKPQIDLMTAGTRFRVVPAGRRSGKTECAKRFVLTGDPLNGILGALTYSLPFDDGWFVLGAPTNAQAKRIWWNDLKSLIPSHMKRKVNESELLIKLYNNVEIQVLGMDVAERIEGRPLDGCILDEYANMKPDAWTEHVRPALSTPGREGWAWLIGVPEGRNHYYQLFEYARSGEDPEWSAHTWFSEIIVAKKELAAAKRLLDPLIYEQEYKGSFVNFAGRAYYCFEDDNKFDGLLHFPGDELIFCFDFNVAPGTAVVCQEQTRAQYTANGITLPDSVADEFTAVIGEVHIPIGSNTIMVCGKLVDEWKERHVGPVLGYGDATGGARGTSQVRGSDWDLIDEAMDKAFGDRWTKDIRRFNPRERVRVNSVNARCRTADGALHMLFDPAFVPHTIFDFEGVRTTEDGDGQIDKKKDPALTHLTDAIGYYIYEAFPIGGPRAGAATMS